MTSRQHSEVKLNAAEAATLMAGELEESDVEIVLSMSLLSERGSNGDAVAPAKKNEANLSIIIVNTPIVVIEKKLTIS